MLQAFPPDTLEEARPYPGLETQVARAAGTVFAGDHLPLATRAQDVQNAVEHDTIEHPWPTVGPGRFVGRQDGFDQFPQILWNLPQSITPLLWFGHRLVLHDSPTLLSARECRREKGF